MSSGERCKECGTAIPADSPGGFCAQCLLGLGLSEARSAECGVQKEGQELGSHQVSSPLTEKPGDRIGRYRLLQEIGHGGCGVVYMAEQEEPVRRKVALKVIKLGMDTRQVVARFEAERQALALMDHPNIAKIYDAGVIGESEIANLKSEIPRGRPYFVMELVGGIKITDYCQQQQYTTRQRLDLFIQVCRAVQHAHQKGVIHRDIKPSNILVAEQDGVPVPKVIDFGIAKATQGKLTDQTLFTAFEQFLGTPAYMSPEQAQLGGMDVDTRSDIYSLGVLLYELLTGTTPFDTKQLVAAGLDEMRRTIREVEPVKPSTRLTQTAKSEIRNPKPEIKSALRIPQSQIDHDLDWIVMKCLEKDRARRYETANGLAGDIERHLNQELVVARPPSALYSLQKLVRRNKLVVTAGALVAVVLLLGIVGIFSQWRRADEARRDTTRSNEQLRQALNQMDSIQLQRAEEYMAEERRLDALPRWALVLRNDPSNRIAAERLMSTLSHRTWARLACAPMEHSNRVTFAIFSADGKRVVTSSADNAACVWDAATGQRLAGPFMHGAEINTAVFSWDGRFVVTASQDKTARIWNALTGNPVTHPLVHNADVTTAQFSPDGKLILTTSGGLGQLWDAGTGQRVGAAFDGGDFVFGARFSPGSSLVALACADGLAQLWEIASGVCRHRLQHAKHVGSVSFGPNGKRLVTASQDKTARVWDVESGQPICEPLQHQGPVAVAEFSPDGYRIVTASSDHTAQIWDARTGEKIGPPLKHTDAVRWAMFSPEGLRVVTASWDKTVRVWDALTGEPLAEPMAHDNTVFGAQFSPDGERVLTTCNDKAVLIWEVIGAPALTFQVGARAGTVDFSPDGKRIAVASDGGHTRVWDALTGGPTQRLDHPAKAWVNQVSFSSDGKLLATACNDGKARIWQASDGRLVATLSETTNVQWVAFSPDGTRLLTSGRYFASVWDYNNEVRLVAIDHDAGLSQPPSFSPDGTEVLTATETGLARVWDAHSGKPVTLPLSHATSITSAQFSPDGKFVLTTARETTFFIWEKSSSRRLEEHWMHRVPVTSAFYSRDGKRVLTSSSESIGVQIWDLATGVSLTGEFGRGSHTSSPLRAVFSHNDSAVVIPYPSMSQVWDSSSGQRLSESLRRANSNSSRQFSPDGSLVADTFDEAVRIWETPAAALPVPKWLPELAEALGGKRFDMQGMLVTVHPTELWVVQKRMLAWANGQTVGSDERDALYARWARWFLADASTRTVLPSSPLTLPEYVQSLLEQLTPEARRQALLLQPSNVVALALAGESLTNQMLAVWMTRRSTELAPDRFETWHHLAGALNKSGRKEEAIAAMEQAVALNMSDPNLRQAQAELLQGAGHMEAAVEAFGKVIELIGSRHGQQKQAALLSRSRLLASLGRHAEAQADLLKAKTMGLPEKVIFEMASDSDLEGWTLKGSAFTVGSKDTLVLHPSLNSVVALGEEATGSALSPPFRVESEFEYLDVLFQGGWNRGAQGDENLVLRFVDADSGAILDHLLPPGTHELRMNRVKTTNIKGKFIRLLLVDNNTNSSYAWIGLRKVSLTRELQAHHSK